MTVLAVIDTHALLWAATGQRRRLGRRALRFLDRVDAGEAAVYVATMSLVELGEACWRGTVRLEGGFDAWLAGALSSGQLHPVDLTVAIVQKAQALYSIPERGDRLIAATAAVLDVQLITRDPEIAEAAGIEIVW